MLEEVYVSSQGDERVQFLRSRLASFREIERLNSTSADYEENYMAEPHTTTYKNDSPGISDVVVHYDQDLGVSPMNFQDVFFDSKAYEGIRVSMGFNFGHRAHSFWKTRRGTHPNCRCRRVCCTNQ